VDVVVVDDGSSDGTAAQAEAAGARVLRLDANGGYGNALKAGIADTTSEHVVIIDADGTYPEEAILWLLARAGEADMVVGARAPNDVNIPLTRRWAKRFLTWLASYLAGRQIPDLNSGLRLLRRPVLERFLPLLPAGFSFTTTITLALLCTNHRVVYEPICYRPRIGPSKVRAFHFAAFLLLVVRTVLLFNPLKVFWPLGALLFAGGLGLLACDVWSRHLSGSAVLSLVAAVLVWSLGFFADMISRLLLHLYRPQ